MNQVFEHAVTPLEQGTTVIAASAGTGKTFTIAALVVRLVAELDIPIHRLLLTTYTVAATAELRDRIRARLISAHEVLRSNAPPTDEFLRELRPRLPAEAPRRLATAIRDFDEANVHTIHAFCQRALREQAFETGTPFQTELLTDATALLTEAAEDYWRQHVYPAPPLVHACIALEKLTPVELLKSLREVSSHSRLAILPDASEITPAVEELTAIIRELRDYWSQWRNELTNLLVTRASWAKGDLGKTHEVREALAALEELQKSTPSSAMLIGGCQALCKFTTEAVVDGTRKSFRSPSHPFFELCDRFSAARAHLRATTTAHFLHWARLALDERKRERGFLLFDDLLTRLHAALNGEDGASLARQLGGRFDAVLVDEFQDTDPIQAEIFQRLFGTKKHWLFLIGDPKQAIYGFRGADLFAYLAAIRKADRHYTLQHNQRSAALLVEAVNRLFSRPALPFLDCEIPFEPVHPAGRADQEPFRTNGQTRPPFHFWFWKDEDRISAFAAREQLPAMIATEVARLLEMKPTIGGRVVTPGDCAVLCSDNYQARSVAEALAVQGVPAIVFSHSNVFSSPEADELRLILLALAEPGRESLLRSALTTSPLGMDLADLLKLQEHPIAWEEIRQRWQNHHQRWRDLGFIRMFRGFLREEQVRQRLLQLTDGERRLTNLQHLAELIHAAAEAEHLGPTGLIHWFDRQTSDLAAVEEKELRLERDDAAVRVVTIHKSKGLEYPIVFCPFLWRNAGLKDKEPLFFHNDHGALFCDLSAKPDPEHLRRAADERLAEQTRLLYVALTRARYECHVVWGGFVGTSARQPETSALLRLLEPNGSDTTFVALAAHAETLTPGQLERTVQKLCAAAPASFAMHVLPASQVPRMAAEAASDLLKPRTLGREIDRTWRTTSYSALAAIRETRWDEDEEDLRLTDVSLLTGIHAFPRGTKSGACLHDILEHLDFAAPSPERERFVARKLQQHAMSSEENCRALLECIDHIRAVLPAGVVDRKKSLRELEFHLPAGMLSPARLVEFAGAALVFEPQRGVLRGFIDLVFEHEGKFHILDWKSNWLGPTPETYTREAMEAEMRLHRYGLQRQLYSFALHRFLQLRLVDYNPDQHLGGAIYVFVRGLDPARPELGVLRTPPDIAGLRKMEELFPKP